MEGNKHGRGIYYFSNGDVFKGSWNLGTRHGIGEMTYANGRVEIQTY